MLRRRQAAAPGDGVALLTWQAPSADGGAPITGYQWGGDNSGGGWRPVPGDDATRSYLVTGLTNGTSYILKVRAVNAAGVGPETAALAVTPNVPPSQPTGLAAVAASNEVTLSWPNPGNSLITAYQYRYDASASDPGEGNWDQDWTEIAGSDATTVEHTVTGLTNGTEYTFQIRAMRGNAASVESDTVTLALLSAKPANFAATEGDGQVTLTWDDPNDGTITGYEVQQSTDGGTTWDPAWTAIAGSGSTTVEHTVKGLTNGTEYTFQIRAMQGAVEGVASDTVTATPVAAPAQPTGLTATASTSEVRLTWTLPGNPLITAYQVRQSADGGAWTDWTTIDPSGAATTVHFVEGLAQGITYTFQIRAMRGSVASVESEVTVALLSAKPANFAATEGDGRVKLSWTNPNDGTITGYEVQQSTDGGAWTPIADSALGGANAVSFTVENLDNGTEYTFNLRAVNSVGDGAESGTNTATPRLNARPVAVADTAATDEDTAVTIRVLANDTDAEGDPLTVSSVSDPAHGTAAVDPDAQTVTYTPDSNYNGRDTLTYAVSDGRGDTVTGTVTVWVYASVPTSGTQTIHGVLPGVPTVAGNPQGTLTVEFAGGSSESAPFQVRLDRAAQDCAAPVAGLALVTCVQVDLFDLYGNNWGEGEAENGMPFNSAILNVGATSTQAISVYRRDDPGVAWTLIPECSDVATGECFTVSGNEVTIRNIGRFSQFAVFGPQSATAGTSDGRTVRRRSRPTPTPVPTVIAATPAPMMVATPAPTEMATVPSPTAMPEQQPATPTVTPVVAASPTPPPAALPPTNTPTPTDTPAAVAAIPNTPVPASTTAVPPAVEAGSGFPAWLIVVIAAAVIIAGGLGFGAWRMLRQQ